MTGRAELEAVLLPLARMRTVATYKQVADALGLVPPQTVHRTAMALEALMEEHAAEGRPQLAAVVVARARGGLPAPGFFAKLAALGLHDGPETGPEAAARHAAELDRVYEHWGAPPG